MDGTFFTYLFCLISGFVVGFWLFYRDRSQDDSIRQKLKKENNDLRRNAQTSQLALDSLDEKFSRQRGKLNVLQQLCDDWSSSRETSERERAQMESDLEAKTSRISEIENEYRDEKRKRIELEDKLHKQAEETLAERTSIEDVWRTKYSETETALQTTGFELKSLQGEREQLLTQLHEANAAVAELKSELESSKSLIETATTNATGLKQEYVSLETALKASSNQLKKAEACSAKALSEKDAALKSAAAFEAKLTSIEKESLAVGEANNRLQSKLDSIEAQLNSSQQQLAKVTQQRDQALESEKATGVVVTGLQKRLDNQESTIHLLRQNQDDALENLKHELKVRGELESKFDARVEALRAEAEKLATEHEAELGDVREQIKADFETQICELKEQLKRQASQYAEHSKDLRNQLSLQREELNKERTRLDSELENERKRLSSESESIASRLTTTSSQLQSKIEKLEADASTYTESIVKLDAQKEQLKQELESTRQQMRSQLKQDSETIGNLQRERDNLKTEMEQLHASISPLHEKVESHRAFKSELDLTRARIVDLERELTQRDQESKRLQAQANELQRLRQRYQDANDQQKRLQQQIDEMVSRQIAREAQRNELHVLIQELEAKLRVSEETVKDLREERAMVLASLADQRQSLTPESTVISFTQSMDKPAAPEAHDYDNEYGGRMRRDVNRGMVFTETPSTCDDLKRISGIAEVLEKRLNDFGIYTFKQVMDWCPQEIEEFSRLLAFRDRIVRDDWQGQARFFYNQKRKAAKAAA